MGGGGGGGGGTAPAPASLDPWGTLARPGEVLGSGPGLTVVVDELSSRRRDRRRPRGDAGMVGMGDAAEADALLLLVLLLLLDRSLKEAGEVVDLLWV